MESGLHSQGQNDDINIFKQMNLTELQKHKCGLLNLFEQHSSKLKGKLSLPFFRVVAIKEYDSIFDYHPSFYEKQAFTELFLKKWREEKGY